MNKSVSLILFALTISICNGQTADDLNKQARDFLTKGDTKNAYPLLKEAAELNQPEAQYNYGFFFQQGIEVEKPDSLPNFWLLKSANQGWLDAQFKIAYSYAVGRGCTKDMTQAFYWSVQCGQQNDPECMNNVISCYNDGTGTNKNLDSALAWTIRLASLPDLENLQLSGIITGARKSLAIRYRDGNYVAKDKIKSYMWFLIYNESKRDFAIFEQRSNIDSIKELENNLSQSERDKAKQDAEKQIGRKLKQLDNLYKDSLEIE